MAQWFPLPLADWAGVWHTQLCSRRWRKQSVSWGRGSCQAEVLGQNPRLGMSLSEPRREAPQSLSLLVLAQSGDSSCCQTPLLCHGHTFVPANEEYRKLFHIKSINQLIDRPRDQYSLCSCCFLKTGMQYVLEHHLTTQNNRRKPSIHDQLFVDKAKAKIPNGLCIYMIYMIYDIQNTQSTGFSYFNYFLFQNRKSYYNRASCSLYMELLTSLV